MWRFVDHKGSTWLASELRQRYRLTAFSSNQNAVDWAIKNVGLVLIGETDRSVRVRLRLAKTPAIALAEALHQLACTDQRRASISIFDGEWQHSLFPSAQIAAEQLAALAISVFSNPSTDLLRRRFSPTALEPSSDLNEIFIRVHSLDVRTTLQDVIHQLPDSLANRVIILETSQAHSRLTIRHVGSGFTIFDPRWVARAVGRDMEDQPDTKYGRWTSERYRTASESMTPVADEIDAVVENPYDRTRHRSRYRRLILPIACRKGRVLLLGCSTLDPNINLRRQVG